MVLLNELSKLSGRWAWRVFARAFDPDVQLLIGADGIPVADFLLQPVEEWVEE